MLNSILTTPLTAASLVISLAVSLVLGILSGLVFSFKHKNSSSLSLTLAILPVAMCMIVMMVNGNLGIAVAVAGGFTLVRFRSIAGNGREISAVFIVMTLGVIVGMGYVGIAVIFFAIVAVAVIVLTALGYGECRNEKYLRITIPESYDYTNLFDDVFEKYDVRWSLEKMKTTNMGTLIDLTYRVRLSGETVPKEMLDELRVRNSNLGIMVTGCEEARERL